MRNPYLSFLRLVGPFVMSIVLMVSAGAMLVSGTEMEIQFNIPIVFIDVAYPIKNPALPMTLLGLGCLAWPAFRNYAGYYPTHLTLQIHFDLEGLERTIETISEAESKELNLTIDKDWKDYQQYYLDYLNHLIQQRRLPSFVRFSGTTCGNGEVTFRVVRVGWFQTYRIEKSSRGNARFMFRNHDRQRRRTMELEVQLALAPEDPSGGDRIHGTLKDIYTPSGWTKVIRPTFCQYVQIAPGRRLDMEDMPLVCVTKLRFFPLIGIGNTIYLVEKARLGSR